jgi:peptidoglycan hydrolase CwlO-like protein
MNIRARALLTALAAAALITAILAATLRHARSKLSTDNKDQEIELLKLQVQQLQEQVNRLQATQRTSKGNQPQTRGPGTDRGGADGSRPNKVA